LHVVTKRNAVSHRVAHADLRLWLSEGAPVILIVYDAQADVAYWLDVQEYFEAVPQPTLKMRGTTTVYLPQTKRINPVAGKKTLKKRTTPPLGKKTKVDYYAEDDDFFSLEKLHRVARIAPRARSGGRDLLGV